VVLAVWFTACKENPDPEPVMLPAKIIFDNNQEWNYKGTVMEFSYDNNNRITGLSMYYPDYDVIGDYIYYSSGQLNKIEFTVNLYPEVEIQTTHFAYSDHYVTATIECTSTCKPYGPKYELQNNRMIKEYIHNYESYYEYKSFLYDSIGNITKVSNTQNNNSVTISYDDKKGIFSGINNPNWLLWYYLEILGFQTENNPVKLETLNSEGNIISTTLYEYSAFNSYNYPTKIKIDGLYEIEIKYIEAK